MDMSSESSAARWYEPPRSTLEPPSGGAGVAGVVANPTDYRGYYPHAGPTAHHPAAAAHYAHSKLKISISIFSRSIFFFFFLLVILLELCCCRGGSFVEEETLLERWYIFVYIYMVEYLLREVRVF